MLVCGYCATFRVWMHSFKFETIQFILIYIWSDLLKIWFDFIWYLYFAMYIVNSITLLWFMFRFNFFNFMTEMSWLIILGLRSCNQTKLLLLIWFIQKVKVKAIIFIRNGHSRGNFLFLNFLRLFSRHSLGINLLYLL